MKRIRLMLPFGVVASLTGWIRKLRLTAVVYSAERSTTKTRLYLCLFPGGALILAISLSFIPSVALADVTVHYNPTSNDRVWSYLKTSKSCGDLVLKDGVDCYDALAVHDPGGTLTGFGPLDGDPILKRIDGISIAVALDGTPFATRNDLGGVEVAPLPDAGVLIGFNDVLYDAVARGDQIPSPPFIEFAGLPPAGPVTAADAALIFTLLDFNTGSILDRAVDPITLADLKFSALVPEPTSSILFSTGILILLGFRLCRCVKNIERRAR